MKSAHIKVLTLISLCIASAFSPAIFAPGLQKPEAIGKFLNGKFPASLESEVGIGLDIAYPSMNFSTSMGIYQAPRSSIVFVIERGGKIYSFNKNAANPSKSLFLDVSSKTWTGQDSGLMGLAFHPQYNQAGKANRNYFYIYYITQKGSTQYLRLSRYTRPDGQAMANANSEQILIEQKLGPTLHRGGGLLFGKDGFLYLAIGDLGWKEQSQNITDRFSGGVLRIDVDRKGGSVSHPIRRKLQDVNQGFSGNYYVPNDNPFLSTNGSRFEEYYTLGCRNPHKMSMDSQTGKIYIGNVGSNSGQKKEEINVVSKGANFGWPFREGKTDRPDIMKRPSTIIGSLKDPIFDYLHTEGNRCIIGGYVYRGNAIPSLKGKYVFGDYGSRKIWSIGLDGNNREEIGVLQAGNFPTMGQTTDGEILIGLGGNKPLYQIKPVTTAAVPKGWYLIKSRHSGKMVSIAGNSKANGGNIYQWAASNGANQQWFIEPISGGYYRIKSKHSNLYLDAAAFGTKNGTNIHQWSWNNTNNQKWKISSAPDGHFFFTNIHNNLVMDVAGVSKNDGANIYLWSQHSGANQQWELIPINGTTLGIPKLLSRTGAFTNLRTLEPAKGILPYEVNTPLWSDGAKKKRWVAIPNDGTHNTAAEKVSFTARGDWKFPKGTVFIKHFELALDESKPNITKKLETRFMIHGEDGDYYGITYKWNDAGTDAVLLENGQDQIYKVKGKNGNIRNQSWRFPSRSECFSCHTAASGRTLGLKTNQLNKSITYPSTGKKANQLETWNHLGILNPGINVQHIDKYLTSRALEDNTASLEQRVRSYLDSNCSGCHQPEGGPRSEFDTRLSTNLNMQKLINGTVIENLGISGAKLVVPGNPAKSILYQRVKQANTPDAMPPLAKSLADEEAVQLIEQWIKALPASGGGLKGTYFQNPDFTQKVFTKTDRNIDFDWSTGKPDSRIDANTFSIRWEGTVTARFSETYTFTTNADDGVRLWVDGKKIVDDWSVHPARERSGQIDLVAGKKTSIKLEYYENGGHAVVQLFWQSKKQSREIVPAMYLDPEAAPPVLPSNFFAHWKLDKDAKDAIGDAHGALKNGAKLVNDATRKKVLNIGANNHHVLVTAKPQLQVGYDNKDFSVAYWFLPKQAKTGQWRSIMHKGKANGERTFAMWMRPTDNRVHFRISTTASGNEGSDSKAQLAINQWSHIAYIKKGNKLQLYINGKLDREITLRGKTKSNTGNLYFGDTPWYNPVISRLDDIRLYGRGLSAAEVKKLFDDTNMETPTATSCTNPVNLALKKPAKQSSVYDNQFASYAVDGLTGGDRNNKYDQMAHTDWDVNPWWEVDLQEVADIKEVQIYNRTDCCQDRLNNIYVFVSEKPFTSTDLEKTKTQTGVHKVLLNEAVGRPGKIAFNKKGRYVRIQSSKEGYFNIPEVKVMGCGKSAAARFTSPYTPDPEPIPMEVKAYPNPFREIFTIDIKGDNDQKVNVQVVNMVGQSIYSAEQVNTNRILRLGADWPAGMYIIRVTGDGYKQEFRMVKAE